MGIKNKLKKRYITSLFKKTPNMLPLSAIPMTDTVIFRTPSSELGLGLAKQMLFTV